MKSLRATASTVARAVVCALLATAVAGEGETNIYSGPDLVVLYPVEGTAIFVTAVLIASLVEFGIAYLMDIENEYFQLVYRSVAEETIVCSILTMIMIFAKSLGSLQPKWVLMLNYAVLSLFFMIIFFVLITGSCVIALHVAMNKWRRFEATSIDADPKLNSQELLFKLCRDRFRESVVGKDIKYVPDMQFSSYMQRMERFTVAEITDLSWKSWVALAVVVAINGVRSRITTGSTSDPSGRLTTTERSINVGSYIGFVGYGVLLLYLGAHFMLQFRLRSFAQSRAVNIDKITGATELVSSRELLYFGNFRATAHIFQCTILVLEWYLAVFVLGMGYETYNTYGLVSIAIFASAVLPLGIFIYIFPWTITMVTMLNALGDDLDVKEATEVAAEAEGDAEDRGGALAAASKAVGDGPEASLAQDAAAAGTAGERDEWNGEAITLHESSNNRLLDVYVPSLTVRVDHPNKPSRRAFDPRAQRPALSGAADPTAANGSYSSPPRRDQSFYADDIELPPAPSNVFTGQSANRNGRPTNRWIEATVNRSGLQEHSPTPGSYVDRSGSVGGGVPRNAPADPFSLGPGEL